MLLRFSGLSRVEQTQVLSSAGNSYQLNGIESALRHQHPYVHKYNRERRSPAAYAVEVDLEPIDEDYDDKSAETETVEDEDDYVFAAECRGQSAEQEGEVSDNAQEVGETNDEGVEISAAMHMAIAK